MKGLRRILRVSWTAKKTNEWVLSGWPDVYFSILFYEFKFAFLAIDCINFGNL